MRTVGIDLAAQPEDTGVCVIDWPDRGHGEPVRITPPITGNRDPDLLRLMADGAAAVAIDAPFGWPEFMSAHLGAYASDGTWPLRPDDENADGWSLKLRYRETDRAVRALLLARKPPIKLWPLSVSSNLIAVCAWRCAALLHQHAEITESEFDRTGERGRIYEAYPAAALASWGLPFRGYKPGTSASQKTARAREKREEITDRLDAEAPWLDFELHPDLRGALVADDDLLDAFVSALVARAAVIGRTVDPRSMDEQRLAPTEGWIHVPAADSLGSLHRT